MSEPDPSAVDWRTVAAASTDGVGVVDGETVVHADEQFAAAFGYDDADSLVDQPWRELYPSSECDRIESEVLTAVDRDGAWRGDATGLRPDGTAFPQTLSIRRIDGDALAWAVRDVSDRVERDQELDRYESILDTVSDSVYALDENLQFRYVNDALCETFGLDREEALGTDVRLFFDDDDDARMADAIRERVVTGNTDIGAFQVALPTPDGDRSFEVRYRLHPDPDGEFRGSVGVIRDVTEREERERKLERRRDELSTLTRINELLFEITHELVGTVSREAVERTVCERLAESEFYRFAWTGKRELDGDRVIPRANAGDDGYLDAVTPSVDADAAEREPVGRALRTGEVHTETVDSATAGSWQTAAFDRGFRSVLAVPFRHRETVYGVLAVYATRSDAFSERERHGFGVLGETIGFAIAAIKRRQLLFADAVTELEFQVTESESFLGRASRAHNCRFSLDGFVSSGDRWILYAHVDGAPAERIVAEASDDTSVERARVISDDSLLELVVTEPSLLESLTAAGGQVREATVEDGVGRVVIDVPLGVDVHRIVEQLDASFSGLELLARRERERTPEQVQALGGLLDDLTGRQREALEAAFRAGYFEWPRASTAEDVAGAMDVSAPTLHAHLRKAEDAVFASLFE